MGPEFDSSTEGVIFAGQRYREFSVPALLSDVYCAHGKHAQWGAVSIADYAIMNRTDDPIRLNRILDKLEGSSGAKRFLAELAPFCSWLQRGTDFFFEPGDV